MSGWNCRWKATIEFTLQDLWVGVFWKHHALNRSTDTDIYICILPCFPIHIDIYWYRQS